MSDYWSGLLLVGIILLGIAFGIIALLEAILAIFKKKTTQLSRILFATIFILLLIWTVDRLIAGFFCLPWECVDSNVRLESLLLNNSDLSDEWNVEQTFDDTYVPRASADYRERTFGRVTTSINQDFYEEVYQYRSIRGASFQYAKLKNELPTSYSPHSVTISPQFDIQVRYATDYDFDCVFYDRKVLICYYLARYDEYVLLLQMRSSDNDIPNETFSGLVDLADEKFSKVLGK